MANNPGTPDNNPPQTPGTPGGTPSAKPRATIMLKKNNPAGGSQPQIVPATPSGVSSPGASGRIPVAGQNPGASARRTAVTIPLDREKLGLSTSRPSELVSGLDAAAKRAEAIALRDEAKRKSGGKMNLNVALHVDDTGNRWKRQVLMGIIAVVLIGGAITATLMYLANRTRVSDRAAFEETRGIINGLAKQTELMKPFAEGESITVQNVKERVTKDLEESVKEVQEQMKRDSAAKRNPDTRAIERRIFVEKLMTFKDGWSRPLVIQMQGKDDVEFSSTGKFEGNTLEPVKVRVRAGAASSDDAPPEKADKSDEPKSKPKK